MGNDGGDIPRRSQLVKTKKKAQVASSESRAKGRARYCNLTNQKLKAPLAICRLGCIYNYELILAALLKKTLDNKYAYIHKLSDIKQIKVEKTNEKGENYIICPITKLEYNGFNKFVGIWKCGHVISRKAFKQVKVEQENQNLHCIICNAPYQAKDIIDLNLEPSQLERKRTELIAKVQIAKKKKENQQAQKNFKIEKIPQKKVKLDIHVNSLDRLSGQFRDVLRGREKFKEIFGQKIQQ